MKHLSKDARKRIEQASKAYRESHRLFIRWLELQKITDALDVNDPAFQVAQDEQDAIINTLSDEYHLLLAWDREAKQCELAKEPEE